MPSYYQSVYHSLFYRSKVSILLIGIEKFNKKERNILFLSSFASRFRSEPLFRKRLSCSTYNGFIEGEDVTVMVAFIEG